MSEILSKYYINIHFYLLIEIYRQPTKIENFNWPTTDRQNDCIITDNRQVEPSHSDPNGPSGVGFPSSVHF